MRDSDEAGDYPRSHPGSGTGTFDLETWRSYLLHRLTGPVAITVQRGSAMVIAKGQRIELRAPAAGLFGAGVLFGLRSLPRGGGTCHCLAGAAIGLLQPGSLSGGRLVRLDGSASARRLLDHLQTLERECGASDPLSPAACAALTRLAVIEFSRLPPLEAEGGAPSAACRLSAQFAAMVAAEGPRHRTVAHFSGRLGVTPTHLARACRQACGLGPSQILGEVLLHEALVRMAETDAPLAAIAADLGFSSAGYFGRFVQRHTGLRASQLRRLAFAGG